MNDLSKPRTKSVLVVSADTSDRDRYGGWLEDEGFEVLSCPGPTAPDYVCLGGRTGTCVLARTVDLVLLDSSLPGEDMGYGTSTSELVTIYASLGKPVLELARLRRDVAAPATWLPWPLSRDDLVAAVRIQL
jgi:hypothetical protein